MVVERTLASVTSGRGLLFGGDYNPEQWDEAVWAADAEAMVVAGVNLVTVGVFSWSALEPAPGRREFSWLDRVIDLLWAHGIGVDLATPTASPPRWLSHAHPETLPVTATGVRLSPGSRNHFCPSAVAYRAAAAQIVTDLVAHYAEHPAVQLWHVGNEFGQVCYCDSCADAFRAWVRARYESLDALNAAWGTAVWSQQFSDWAEVLPPREAVYVVNPAHVLDWRRYCSDALLALFDEQAAIIRGGDRRQRPVTTNFMGFYRDVDAFGWAGHLDVVSDDAYPDPGDPASPAVAALTGDLLRSLAGGPWLLMEQATSAVSWREHNLPKSEARMRADAFRAVAHGSDGVLSFQWRASRAGAERFHSAMLPHAGTDTRLHRSVVRLGADLARLGLAGTPIAARVGLLFDWASWWAAEERGLPSGRLRVLPQLQAWYRPLWRRGVPVDLVQPDTDLGSYDLLLAPQLMLLDDAATANLRGFVAGGGTLALGPFSAVVDANAAVRTGRFPAGLTDLLGAGGEEWCPLPDGGVGLVGELDGTASVWGELFPTPDGSSGIAGEARDGRGAARVLSRFADGDLAGHPAALASPDGRLRYLATVPDDAFLDAWIAGCLAAAAVPAFDGPIALPIDGIEAARRGTTTFVTNLGDEPRTVPLLRRCTDALSGRRVEGSITLAPLACTILQEGQK